MAKTANDAAGEATSKSEESANANDAQPGQALVQTGDGDVSGPLALALSSEMQDKLMQELQESLHQVAEGFGNLTAPGEIYKMGTPFTVIDAITIPDYVDRKTGEEKIKHVFKLEFPDGTVKLTMQSDARPRRILATSFQKARALGAKAKAGPYLYEQKPIPGQIQPAYIFVQQKGFEAKAYI